MLNGINISLYDASPIDKNHLLGVHVFESYGRQPKSIARLPDDGMTIPLQLLYVLFTYSSFI